MLEDALLRGWENFVARTEGPMSLRFVVQPVVASVMAMRAGMRDAKAGRPAFLWAIFTESGSRKQLVLETVHDVRNVLALALILDSVYQLIVLHGIYFLELIFTAFLLAIVPYICIRGPVNRISRLHRRSVRERAL